MADFLQRLKQRKLVQWAAAYVASAFALLQGVDIVAQRFGWPDRIEKLLILALAVGFVVALLLAWYHGEQGRQRVSGVELLLLALVLAVGGGMAWQFGHVASVSRVPHSAAPVPRLHAAAASSAVPIPAKSIAVLPFENLSADKENAFFSDGLSEEILNSLSRIDGLQVIARTSSFQFKGKDVDVRIIGARLGVANILEGSVRREGDRARVSAQLIRASDGVQLWSQSYDRTVKDSLAVQLDIAEQVAAVMNVVLDDRQRERMRNAGVKNVDAFIAYQKGWKLYIGAHRDPSIGLLEGLRRANAEFNQAIALEPNFSFAYYAKADLYEHTLIDDRSSSAERLKAQSAALQTLARAAETSPDAQQRELALAERQMLSDDWRGLAHRIETALAQPGCSAPNWLPVFASAFDFGDRLEPVLKRAAECDPLNGINWRTREWVARADGQPQRMLAIIADFRKRNPGAQTGGITEAVALAMLGRMDEAKRDLAAVPDPDDSAYLDALVALRLVGDSLAQARAWVATGGSPQAKIRQHAITALVEAALYGTREEANRAAAALGARPAGGLLLATAVTYCDCGAPFDLDATPNFKARLAESGLHWPPTVAMKFPSLPKARP